MKLHGSNLKFRLKTVSETEVYKILKSLKAKKSYGVDGITSEILNLGAEVLVVPLTYIINFSIVTENIPLTGNYLRLSLYIKKETRKN